MVDRNRADRAELDKREENKSPLNVAPPAGQYKIAMIGSPDSILGFTALGIETFGVLNTEEAKKTLEIIKKENYAIIFICENWYEKIPKEIEKMQKKALPAVISIPSQYGSTGAGLENLRKIVEQAVGSDILFNK